MRRGLIISDLHCGNVGGLTPPGYGREDLSGIHRVFWNWYIEHLAKYKPFDFLLGLGDFTDGEGKKGALDTAITDVRKQAEAAERCIAEAGVNPRRVYLVRGTPFHSNGAGEYEDKIADDFGCSIKDMQKIEIEGWKIHTRHVVGRSDTAYGQATPLLKELARAEHEAFRDGKDAPDVVIRGHVHYAMTVSRNGRLAIDCPCLELPIASANGRRYMAWDYTVGFGVLDLEEGVEPLYRAVVMPMRLVHEEDYQCVTW